MMQSQIKTLAPGINEFGPLYKLPHDAYWPERKELFTPLHRVNQPIPTSHCFENKTCFVEATRYFYVSYQPVLYRSNCQWLSCNITLLPQARHAPHVYLKDIQDISLARALAPQPLTNNMCDMDQVTFSISRLALDVSKENSTAHQNMTYAFPIKLPNNKCDHIYGITQSFWSFIKPRLL
ncbi:hypothetical protein DSO57_1016710 [Entomophthora muscae]|uniref:Uncharacterized protein n=1 Tax=Entomophthora muscae TaxID=34485 RepID=A0ACC2S6Z2_9FUNG|nr:hypothetical protein DSO57_1016710 [Entomophthora muscae]